MNQKLFKGILALACWTSCASTAFAGDPPATQPSPKKPFMFDEAKLPKGYPAPGTVGQVIVKQYPPARAAMVKASALKDGSDNSMFWPLFQHIQKNNIAMSAPVDMTWSASAPDDKNPRPQAMAFIYGDPTIGQPGADGVVEVVDVPAMTVVSVAIRGSYDADHFKQGIKDLQKWLDDHSKEYKVAGPPRYLGYNSPMVPPMLRLGEVQIPVALNP